MSLKVLYFASLKEYLDKGEDSVDLPPNVKTVAELKDFLGAHDPKLKEAFATMPRLRFAVNQEMATGSSAVKDGDEVAIFPPVTGG
ncbi:MAG: molybdopterin converting factor subunit 1 [Burkholderiales bacterium]|nr:molybdopterin converting factor subunit 1 [Burkholderiales bacterium]